MDGDAHEARLVEGGGDRSDGRPQGAAPAQEEQLGYGGRATQVRQRAFLMQRCSCGVFKIALSLKMLK